MSDHQISFSCSLKYFYWIRKGVQTGETASLKSPEEQELKVVLRPRPACLPLYVKANHYNPWETQTQKHSEVGGGGCGGAGGSGAVFSPAQPPRKFTFRRCFSKGKPKIDKCVHA